jgi:replicative DNA helicase
LSAQEQPAQPVHNPYDIDIEQALIGSMLRDSALIPQAAGILEDWHFYDPLHGRIFGQMVAWSNEGDRAITVLTVYAAMKADAGIIETGGQSYLQAMYGAAPAIPAVRDYALIIREHSMRRDALAALDEAKTLLLEGPSLVRDCLASISSVADEAERYAAQAKFQSTDEAADESIRDAERASSGQPVRAVKTGMTKVDNETGGFQGADLIIVAGKPGMGKSALMGGFSWQAAAAFVPTIVFSLEMKRKPWTQRILTDIDFAIADANAIAYRKFRATGVTADGRTLGFSVGDFARMMFARDHLRGFSPWLEIHDEDGLTVAQMAARARAFQAKWRNDPRIREGQKCAASEDPIGLVIVDYIQIVDPASRQFRPREQEVAGIVRGLKGLAKKLNWPVVAGSQLNEDDKARGKENQRPRAGDVRESKAIRQEADIMLLPYRMAEALSDARPDSAPGEPAWNTWNSDMQAARNHFDLIVGKNRMGRKTTLSLWADMAASAVRDEQPMRRGERQEDEDLITGLLGDQR